MRSLRRVLSAAERHALATVAVVAAVAVLADVLWVRAHRPLGAFNTDEAGFLATSLAVHRAVAEARLGLAWDAATASFTGPLLPLLGGAAAVAERAPWAILAVTAVARGVAAVVVAAVVGALGGSGRRAVLAGLVALGWPAAILAGRSVQPATLAACAVLLAVLAVLRSDAGRRWAVMAAAGGAMGLAVLARPMVAAFVPGLLLAALASGPMTRRGAAGLGIAGGVAATVVGGWLVTTDGVTGYLVEYGVGDTAADYGPGALVGRPVVRAELVLADARLLLVGLGAALLVVAWRGRGVRAPIRPSPVVGLWVAVGWGAMALLATSNRGTWFELPLELLAVAGLAVVPVHLRHPHRWAVAIAVASLVNLLAVGRLAMLDDTGVGSGDGTRWVGTFLFADQYRPGVVRHVDPVLGADREERGPVAEAWWAAAGAVVASAREATGSEGVDLAVAGSDERLSLNVLRLARELPIGPTGDDGRLDEVSALDAPPGDAPALVVVDSHAEPFPGEVAPDVARSAAEARGWTRAATVDLPDGGTAEVWVPPG